MPRAAIYKVYCGGCGLEMPSAVPQSDRYIFLCAVCLDMLAVETKFNEHLPLSADES